jgi:phage-related baseplate assembly protein
MATALEALLNDLAASVGIGQATPAGATDLAAIMDRLAGLETAVRTGGGAVVEAPQTVADAIAALRAQISTLMTDVVRARSIITVDALKDLPQPTLLADLDHAATLNDIVARYTAAANEAGMPELAAYIALESTPERRLFQVVAYWIVWLTHRVNQMYRARLLYFAEGGDLDHAADGYGVDRLADEPDADLRQRTRIRNRGSSAAGPDDWWRYHVMTADSAVVDVAVTRNAFPYPAPSQARGDITISILADTADGVPTQGTIDRVTAAVNRRDVRPLGTAPRVTIATARIVNVTADIWLLPQAPSATFAAIEPHFRAAWSAHLALGWDVVRSWVEKYLMVAGVQRVDLIGWQDVPMAAHEAPRLGAVSLTLRGRQH